jgi:hypothetical protein
LRSATELRLVARAQLRRIEQHAPGQQREQHTSRHVEQEYQRQMKLSVIQPPSVGLIAGAKNCDASKSQTVLGRWE